MATQVFNYLFPAHCPINRPSLCSVGLKIFIFIDQIGISVRLAKN